jgi:hypothetical protein
MKEPQEIWYRVVFTNEQKPGSEAHLKHVAETYFKGKGVTVEDGIIRI